ncbi:MAG: S8 family serine peptidase [Promethearchaeota archaeon]
MKKAKIYPLFLNKLENQKKENSNKKKKFRVIISFDNISKRDNFISKNKALNILNKFDLIPSLLTELELNQVLEYEKEKLIEIIEEDQRLHLSLLEVNEILDLKRCKRSQISHTGKNVKIGIIDDGINTNFSSISNVTKYSHNMKGFKRNINKKITHGTIMAGIIGNQFKDYDDTSIGIAPDANFIDFDISNINQEYYFSDVLQILNYIIGKNIEVDILLIALTSRDPSDGKDNLSRTCDLLVDRGILIISPAGNFGPKAKTIGSPSASKKVISIGALTSDLTIAQFSSRGPTIDNRIKPDFCLPGTNIKVPLSNDLQTAVTGTSVSAAIGAGLIALIKEIQPKIKDNEIFEVIKNSSRDLETDQFSQGFGMPVIINIFKERNLIHEKIIPYNFLVKKSLKMSIEFILILIVLFYFFYFFRVT